MGGAKKERRLRAGRRNVVGVGRGAMERWVVMWVVVGTITNRKGTSYRGRHMEGVNAMRG